jgi:hypothetical protein
MKRALRQLVAVASGLASVAAGAVSLGSDGRGQALVFPYYTVRAASEGDFNTYLSLTNASDTLKAVRLVLREAHAGRAVLEMNLYLAPADMWTAALVPDPAGMRLLTVDGSCTDPKVPAAGLLVDGAALATAGDGLGSDAQRVREGYAEALEMAVMPSTPGLLTPVPRSCVGQPSATSAPPAFSAPAGGLAGTGNVINVRSGLQFAFAATALDQLAGAAYFALPGSPVGFDAAAVEPVSVVVDGAVTYRSHWRNGVEAVSALLMTKQLEGEWIADAATRAKTDWVLTFPTRRFYVTATSSGGPFSSSARLSANPGAANCDWVYFYPYGRDASSFNSAGFPERPPPGTYACGSVAVTSFRGPRSPGGTPLVFSDVLGSASTTLGSVVAPASENGWAYADLSGSLVPVDTLAFDAKSGTFGAVGRAYSGLPAVGLALQSFTNGLLDCAGATCKGNYAGVLPLRTRRSAPLPAF